MHKARHGRRKTAQRFTRDGSVTPGGIVARIMATLATGRRLIHRGPAQQLDKPTARVTWNGGKDWTPWPFPEGFTRG